MSKAHVISRVVLKASVHRVPAKVDKAKVRSRGPVGADRKIKELVINATEEEWEKRWVEAIKVLQGKKPAPPKKAAPKSPPKKASAPEKK